MELWRGPVIVAALVSGLVSMAGWLVTFRQSVRLEQMRRNERAHDYQVALCAEIESDLLALKVIDRSSYVAEISRRYETEPGFSILVRTWRRTSSSQPLSRRSTFCRGL